MAKKTGKGKSRPLRWWHLGQRDPIAMFTGWLMISTALLFAATVINAFVLMVTDATLKETMIAANRAWLSPETFRFSVPIESEQTPRVSISYQNVGRFPATDVKIGFGPVVIPLSAPLGQLSDYPQSTIWEPMALLVEKSCVNNEPLKGASVVYPSARIEGNVDREITGTWDPSIKAAVLARQQIVIVTGCFTYRTMNTTFHTGFCRYFYPTTGSLSTNWPTRNCPVANFDR